LDAEVVIGGEFVGAFGGGDELGEAVVGVFEVSFFEGFAEFGGGFFTVGGEGEEGNGQEDGDGQEEGDESEHEVVLEGCKVRAVGLDAWGRIGFTGL